MINGLICLLEASSIRKKEKEKTGAGRKYRRKNCRKTEYRKKSPEPEEKLQMGYKSIMLTERRN